MLVSKALVELKGGVVGRMFEPLVGTDLMVRVLIDDFDAVLPRRQHVRPMDFTGKPLKEFVYVSPSEFSTAASLRTWLT